MITRLQISHTVGLLVCLLLACSGHASEGVDDDGPSPLAVDGAETISVERAHQLFLDGVPFVDVRNVRLYARRHIPNARHLELKSDFTLNNLAELVARDAPVVIYCSGVKCSRSSVAVEFAVEWGFKEVKYFRQGIVGWRNAGLPVVDVR
jgi:rhodanese-related sulfurtransferase